MKQYARAKVLLVFPLNFGHGQQAVGQVFAATIVSVPRRSFIFANVPAFQPARAIHGSQPTHDVTEQAEHTSDNLGTNLSLPVGPYAQTLEHLSHELAMMPLFVFNLSNVDPFIFVDNGMPVASICVSRCSLG
jgi:hypothetical protein